MKKHEKAARFSKNGNKNYCGDSDMDILRMVHSPVCNPTV